MEGRDRGEGRRVGTGGGGTEGRDRRGRDRGEGQRGGTEESDGGKGKTKEREGRSEEIVRGVV